jgi:hypothetical protein
MSIYSKPEGKPENYIQGTVGHNPPDFIVPLIVVLQTPTQTNLYTHEKISHTGMGFHLSDPTV